MNEVLFEKNVQILFLTGLSGQGKSTLANEFAHRLNENKDAETKCRWFSSQIEIDFRRFSMILLNQAESEQNEVVIDDLILILNEKIKSEKQKFLFIFDNVESIQDAKKYLMPNINVKYLITTQQVVEGFNQIQIKGFDKLEYDDYVENYLKSEISKEDKEKLFSQLQMFDQVFPLKLKLTISYINQKSLDIIFKKINQYNAFNCFFEDLPFNALDLLSHLEFLNSDLISFNILKGFGDEILDDLNDLISYRLVEIVRNDFFQGIKMHRFVRSKFESFRLNSRQEKLFKETPVILNRILEVLNVNVPIVNEENSVCFEEDFINSENFLHIIKTQPELERRVDKFEVVKLKYKIANFYLFYRKLAHDAIELFEEIYQIIKSNFFYIDHLYIVQLLRSLSIGYCKLGENSKALSYDFDCYKILSRLYKSSDHADIARSLHSLAFGYSKLGDNDKALQFEMKGYEMRKRLYGNVDHPEIAESMLSIAVIYSRLDDDYISDVFFANANDMFKRLKKKDDNVIIN